MDGAVAWLLLGRTLIGYRRLTQKGVNWLTFVAVDAALAF
jgi:hypothetical protein